VEPRYELPHFRRTHAPLVLTLPAYSRVACTHTPCVGSLFSHALRGLVVLAISVTPGVVSSRSSLTPCVGSLFSHALRGFVVVTRLAWARCARGIRHARRGLVAVFPHALRGLVVRLVGFGGRSAGHG